MKDVIDIICLSFSYSPFLPCYDLSSCDTGSWVQYNIFCLCYNDICRHVMNGLIVTNMLKITLRDIQNKDKKRKKYRNITFLALLLDCFCLLTSVLVSFLQGENTRPHVCLWITVWPRALHIATRVWNNTKCDQCSLRKNTSFIRGFTEEKPSYNIDIRWV